MQNQDGVNVTGKTVSLVGPHGLVTATYDLLVGADGAASQVRLAMVKADRGMSSEVSQVGPMRYVCASHLDARPEWPHAEAANMTAAPLDALQTPPAVSTSGASAQYCYGNGASHARPPNARCACVFELQSGLQSCSSTATVQRGDQSWQRR